MDKSKVPHFLLAHHI